MTRRARLLAAAGLFVAAILVVGVTATSAAAPVLVVTDDDGTELFTVPVDEGDEVAIEYTHSVEKTLVTDVYVVDDGTLLMDYMLFSSYGAGLPSEVDVEREGDRYRYEPPEQRHETLIVTTGHVAEHELIVGDERYDITAQSDGGTIHISIERRIFQ